MTEAAETLSRPWYRHTWPWLIFSVPAISAVLGVAMLVLAVQSNDGLVVDDYYKQGLGINELLDKKTHAAELGLRAQVTMNAERTSARVLVHGQTADSAPLLLRFVHPTRAGEDQSVRLKPLGGAMYEGSMAPLAAGRWHVVLEDDLATWRLNGVWQTTASHLLLETAPESGVQR